MTERFDAAVPIGMDDVGEVLLAGKRRAAAVVFDPRLDSVNEHETVDGRAAGRQQKGVIAPRAGSGGNAGSETSEAVGLKPFGQEASVRSVGLGRETRPGGANAVRAAKLGPMGGGFFHVNA